MLTAQQAVIHAFVHSFMRHIIHPSYLLHLNQSQLYRNIHPYCNKNHSSEHTVTRHIYFLMKRALCIIRRTPHIQIWHYSLLKNAHIHTRSHTRGTEQEMMSPTQPGEMRSAQKTIKTNLTVIHCTNIRSSVGPTVCKHFICMQRVRAEVM